MILFQQSHVEALIMVILSVDTSCDESCVSLIDTDSWKLLADVVHSHIDPMRLYGGVVPEIASREHLKALPLSVHEALKAAGLKKESVDWFSVTNRPGLIGALLVGVSYVKAMAYALQKPYSVMNHLEAHLFSPLLSTTEGGEAPPFPWIALVVSGGHTDLFLVRDLLDYQWLGGTLDDAAGEAFDKVGKLLEFDYPAGPALDRLVREKATEENRRAYAFPRAKVDGFDFSFSGLKTAVANEIRKLSVPISERKLDLSASAQEAILDALIEKVQRATQQFGISQVVVTGGVACNSRLRAKLPQAYFPRPKHCTDNAAMIALLTAIYEKKDRLKASAWNEGAYPSIDNWDAVNLSNSKS